VSGRASTPRFAPWLFLGPFLVIFGAFTAYPLIRALVLISAQTYGPGHSQFVGLQNVRSLMHDPLFWEAMRNTVVFTLGSVFIQLPLALMLAILLERARLPGRNFFRVILFAPSLVGVAFAAMIFMIVFEKRTGLLNVVLHRTIGLNLDFPWLQEYIMPALILAALWMYTGFNMVFFSAALKNVRQDLVESATLDGAGAWSRFRHVVVPAIRPVAAYVVLLSVVGSFQLFELPYLMLNGTGGPGNRGLTVVMYMYQAGFESGDLGYASTIGWALSLVLIACAALQRWSARG
jgi:ABC-type sugar transport system permease subunit